MDIYNIKFTRLQLEIFRLLCVKTGEQLNQTQLAGYLAVSPTAIGKSLPALEKEGIVTIFHGKTNLNLVTLNRDSRRVLDLKRAENMKMLYESGLPAYLEENLPGVTIVLFGSYSKGDDISRSDIDIAVIGRKQKDLDMNVFQKSLQKEIRINYYGSIKDVNHLLLSSICNGIVLSGGIEL